ncbi:MAG TPA: type II/IV secretion system ATPase subunit [Candidatus Thermoplasmatota archaeon]|nr:type II/IV secretion system ATPase subunit [Candidatus Thermoplasmatota archaeon]
MSRSWLDALRGLRNGATAPTPLDRQLLRGRAAYAALGLAPDRPVTPVREVAAPFEILDPGTGGLAFPRILRDGASGTNLYEVVEPVLAGPEREACAFLRETLVKTLPVEAADSSDREARLLAAADQAIVDHSVLLDPVGRERVRYALARDLLGYGPMDVVMRDPLIEDISCDGPGIPLYVFHRRFESMRTTVVFDDEIELDRYVMRLGQRAGKQISIADPILDATLPDSSRLQATLSREVTTRGSSFTIRKFRSDPLTPPDLIAYGTLDPDLAATLWLAMESGRNLLVAGGTASGKTTTLNALCTFIPLQKKIVSIEETREINLAHENWIASVTRTGFAGELSGSKLAGAVDMYRLLEAALRQRPEYILVGEVRGAETFTLFQAMSTGHAVYSTMHADSAEAVVRRLENEPINIPRVLIQQVDGILIQASLRVDGKLVRRVVELTEIAGLDNRTGEILTNTAFRRDRASGQMRFLGKSRILEEIGESRNLDREAVEAEARRRSEILAWMARRGIRRFDHVTRIFAAYATDPEGVAEAARKDAEDYS